MLVSRADRTRRAAFRHSAAAGLFFVFALTAGAASGGDNSAFVSYSNVPMTMKPNDKATVTVRMSNTGTTTWERTVVRKVTQSAVTTTRTIFVLRPVGHDWGVGGMAVSGSVAPGAPRSFQFTITAPSEEGTYPFQWRMARETIVVERPRIPASPDWGFGATTPRKLIVVEKDTAPSFNGQTVPDQEWQVGVAITLDPLPEATGGNGALSYSLSDCLPPGVTRSGRRLRGKPTAEWSEATCTWKVADSDANTAASDTDTVTFKVKPKDTRPKFKWTVSDRGWRVKEAITPVELPPATGGNGALSYSFTEDCLPPGVTRANRRLRGTPTAEWSERTCTWKVMDSDGNTAASDTDTDTFKVEVAPKPEEDTAPVFKWDVSNQGWVVGKSVTVELPYAEGGNGELSYSFTEDCLPPGVTRADRRISGTPTAEWSDDCTWTVTDADDNTAASDSDTDTFKVKVDGAPMFKWAVSDQGWRVGKAITPVELPPATGGTVPLLYSFTDDCLPPGVTRSNRRISGTPTAEWSERDCTWKVTDSDDNTSESDTDTDTFKVEVDGAPSFNGQGVPNQVWWVDKSVTPVELPKASGGNGRLLYSLSGCLPSGVTRTRWRISGTPTVKWTERTCTWTVKDSDGNRAASDTDTVTFTVEVEPPSEPDPDTAPSFGGKPLPNQAWLVNQPVSVELPEASGGNGGLSYSLSACLPRGVTRSGLRLSGKPVASSSSATCTWTVADSDANISASDTDTATFTIEVLAPVLIARPTSLAIDEDGSASFEVKLAARPTGTVTVSVESGDAGAVSVDPASLTFTTSNYGAPRTVTVKGVRDDDVEDESVTVALSASGGGYGGASASVAVTVDDQGEPGLVAAPAKLEMDEGGLAGFEVKLATRPTGTVTVSVSLPAAVAGKATVSPVTLTFTASNHGAAQPVTVASEQDDDVEDETFAVALSASGGGYDGVSASVDVAVTDDDGPGLVVVPPVLEVREGGSEAFTVKLATQPTAAVTVSMSVASRDGDAAAVDGPASLTFTTVNYAAPQTVTVPGEQDADSLDERMTVSLSASGGGYDGLSASVDVTVKDDDAPALVATPPGVSVGEGESETFTVRLATQPSDTVTVSVESGDTDAATANPASLTFTAADYAAAKTVTVTGVQDADAVRERTAVSLDASGGGYDDLSASVDVFVTDDDAAALAVSAAKVEVEEGESETFTVKLATRPSAAVTVSVASGDADAATADPASLTFTAADYAAAKTVTVTGVLEGAAAVALTAAGGDYDGVSAAVGVTVTAPDTSPVFGKTGDETFVKGEPVAVDLLVTGGNAPVECSARPALPAGLALDASACALSGTPTEIREQTEYTFTATDSDGDTATLTFTIEVGAPPLDDASFESYADVPSTMTAGSSATVTVRMRNAGTTTWTSAGGYALGSQRPDDNATWGVSRVPLPAGASPGETVDFTFEITAPAEAGAYPFRWKMVRGAAGWFGRKTALRKITVEDPSFGGATIPDRTWVKAEPIEALTLPEASGGGALTYALTPSPPDGVTFTESTRTLSGTPTALQAATEYAYTATDGGGGSAELRFTIEVEEASVDDASFVSVSGLPSRMAAGGTAMVTVTMRNAGTTTWTPSGSYGLGSWSPPDNETWGLSRAPVSGSVAPNETNAFEFAITAPETTGSYAFSWRMARDPGVRFGSVTGDLTVTVEDPSFGDATIPDQTWARDVAIETLVLPAASGGDGALTYALSPAPPDGVIFTASTRVLAGMPTTAQGATKYVYTATDEDGAAATLSFTIEVEAASADDASFVSVSGLPSRMAGGGTALVTVTMKNTGTTTWTPAGGYGLGSRSSSGKDTWGPRRAPLSGSVAPNESYAFTFEIAAPETTGSYTFSWGMVRDPGMRFGAGTGELAITVEDPSFGDATIADQTWVRDRAIATLVLPAASGGDGSLTYALSPAPPDGVIFTASTRTLAGMPTTARAATAYAYTATDEDGDAATLAFTITVSRPLATAQSSTAFCARRRPGRWGGPERFGAGRRLRHVRVLAGAAWQGRRGPGPAWGRPPGGGRGRGACPFVLARRPVGSEGGPPGGSGRRALRHLRGGRRRSGLLGDLRRRRGGRRGPSELVAGPALPLDEPHHGGGRRGGEPGDRPFAVEPHAEPGGRRGDDDAARGLVAPVVVHGSGGRRSGVRGRAGGAFLAGRGAAGGPRHVPSRPGLRRGALAAFRGCGAGGGR